MEVDKSIIKIDWERCINLGEIGDKVEKVYENEEQKFLVLSKEKILFSDFKGNFSPIILEKIKDLFEIKKSGIQIAKLNKKNIILQRIENTVDLKTYMYENNLTYKKFPLSLKKEVRKIILKNRF
jgi:glycosylphosphatidylinositol transamidase (GPIT) subunit GPI8